MIYLILITGLLIGSFLNVCIYRIPRKETVVTTPSHCTACQTKIKWFDLIPLISYLILGGKCRSCKQKISIQYPIVEACNALLWGLLYLKFGLTVFSISIMILSSALIVISFIDYTYNIIPDEILKILLLFGILFNIISLDQSVIFSGILGFFIISVPLLLIAYLTKGGIGGGDIKLMAVCGLFVGFKLIIVSFFTGALLAGILSIALLLLKFKKKKDIIPLGPFLAMGILISVFWGNEFLDWYLNFFA